MPPFEIKPIEIPKIPEISLPGQRFILDLSEKPVLTTLTAVNFTPENFSVIPRMERNPSTSISVRFQTLDLAESGLVKNQPRFQNPFSQPTENLSLVKASSPPDSPGLIPWSLGLLKAGLAFLASGGGGMGPMMIFSWFFRRNKPAQPSPVFSDSEGRKYSLKVYPSWGGSFPMEGVRVAYPVKIVPAKDFQGFDVTFKIFGADRSLTLKIGKAPDLSSPQLYVLDPVDPLSSALASPEPEDLGLYRSPDSIPPRYVRGVYMRGLVPIKIFPMGSDQEEGKATSRPVHWYQLNLDTFSQTGEKKSPSENLHILFKDRGPFPRPPPTDGLDYVTLSIENAFKIGLVLQDPTGWLRPNPEIAHIFIEYAKRYAHGREGGRGSPIGVYRLPNGGGPSAEEIRTYKLELAQSRGFFKPRRTVEETLEVYSASPDSVIQMGEEVEIQFETLKPEKLRFPIRMRLQDALDLGILEENKEGMIPAREKKFALMRENLSVPI